MWPYTVEESDWLEARKADIAAGRPVCPEPRLTAWYIREAQRMRAEAAAELFGTIGRAIAGAFRRPATRRSVRTGPLPTT